MNQFPSIRKLDQAILYALELAASLSVLLLAFGLIASMANVLTKGSVLSDNLVMQRVWAWTQCIAIDASVAGAIIRTAQYHHQGDRLKFGIYALLSTLLLFTAAIVSNIESVQQTLNIALDSAYTHVFIPVEALIWIRSLAIVLLIVAHALRHVHPQEPHPRQPIPALTPEQVHQLRVLLSQTSVTEMQPETPQITETTTGTEQEAMPVSSFPSITQEEKEKVITAFTQGIPKRKICSHLHWGGSKYTTIVKPVLDAYIQRRE
jgi:hypothetical protein